MTAIHSVLLVNTNAREDTLTRREFVWPIQRALPVPSEVVLLSKLKPAHVKRHDAIIFSGCALIDNAYVKHIPKLKWVVGAKKPMMGICAGQHIIGALFGAKITSLKDAAIGVHPLQITEKHVLFESFPKKMSAYFLHGNEVGVPRGFRSIGKSKLSKNDILLHKEQFVLGLSFHPEVLQKPLFAAFINWIEKSN